jgi:hypothetical protein
MGAGREAATTSSGFIICNQCDPQVYPLPKRGRESWA